MAGTVEAEMSLKGDDCKDRFVSMQLQLGANCFSLRCCTIESQAILLYLMNPFRRRGRPFNVIAFPKKSRADNPRNARFWLNFDFD